MENQIKKLKWQIHAETSLTQIMLWIIILLLISNIFIKVLGATLIIFNFYTLLKSTAKLGKNYFKN